MLEVHPKNICTAINVMKYVHRCNNFLESFGCCVTQPLKLKGHLIEKSPKWVLVFPRSFAFLIIVSPLLIFKHINYSFKIFPQF